MKANYSNEKLIAIAEECQEFEHIINAMGYGYSLLNISSNNYIRRCNDCVNWFGGDCDIFKNEINSK